MSKIFSLVLLACAMLCHTRSWIANWVHEKCEADSEEKADQCISEMEAMQQQLSTVCQLEFKGEGTATQCDDRVKRLMQAGSLGEHSRLVKSLMSLDNARVPWSKSIPILWSGFSNDPSYRTSVEASTDALEDFAYEVDGVLLNPSLNESHPLISMQSARIFRHKNVNQLIHCCWNATKEFWLGLSLNFIKTWEVEKPDMVILTLSKCASAKDGRCKDVIKYSGSLLQDSVLINNELPILGSNTIGWKPLVWILDLHESCDQSLPLVKSAFRSSFTPVVKCQGCRGSLKDCWESAKEVDEFDAWSQTRTQLQPDIACRWKGTKCESGRVKQIWWGGRNIQGSLSRFASLTSLTVLYLPYNKDLSGDCLEISELQQIKRLDLRNTRVTCNMATLSQFHSLERIKLTGAPFHGSIEHLAEKGGIRNLLGLELSRGNDPCNVTGNFEHLKRFVGLDDIYLSGCNVVGNLSAVVASWPNMSQLFFSDTRAYGAIGSAWKPYESILEEIEAARTQVTVQWSDVQFQLRDETKPPFPKLMRLILNDCPLNMDINDFVAPLVMNKRLSTIQASKCGLSGTFTNMRRGALFVNGAWKADFPRYWEPKKIDLSKNDLTHVQGRPASDLVFVNFSGNVKLVEMDDSFLDSNIFLDITETPLEKESLFESSKWQAALDSKPRSYTKFECYPVAWKSKLFVTMHTFAPRALCQCLPGHAGLGNNCSQCPANTFANQKNMTNCTQCPDGARTYKVGRYSIDNCKCRLDHVMVKTKDLDGRELVKCDCKKNAELFEGKCRQCDKNAKKIDGKCVCRPRFYTGKDRCEECNPSLGFACPALNTKTSTWLVQPGWWFQDGFTDMPKPCWRTGICVYNTDFPQSFLRVSLAGVFPPNVALERLTLGAKIVEPVIEYQGTERKQQGGPGELMFPLAISRSEAIHPYNLDISFSQRVTLNKAWVELDFDHCASDSPLHTRGSHKFCWHPISFTSKEMLHHDGSARVFCLFQRCRHGHRGPMCQACAAGWYRRTAVATCQRCTDRRTEKTLFFLGAALLLMVLGAFFGHRYAKSQGRAGLKELLRTKLEIVQNVLGWKYLWPKFRHFIFSCQMLHTISHLRSNTGLFSEREGSTAGAYSRWILEWFGEFDFTILSMRRLSQCLYSEESFYALYWLSMLQVVVVLLITWWVTVCVLKGAAADVMSAALVIYNLTGLKLATRSMMFLSCEHFEGNRSFLTASYDTKCYTWLHQLHKVFGILFFSSWCFIIPLGLCLRMRRFRSMLCPSIPEDVAEREFGEDELRLRLAIREMYRSTPELRPAIPVSEKEMQVYFALSEASRPSCWWFDVIGMSRRQLLAAVLILPQEYELLIGLYYCMAMVFLILVVSPALDSTDSLMEGASYAAMALTLGLLDQPYPTPMLWLPLMLPLLVLSWLLCRAYLLPSKNKNVWDKKLHEQEFVEQFKNREGSCFRMLRRQGMSDAEVELQQFN